MFRYRGITQADIDEEWINNDGLGWRYYWEIRDRYGVTFAEYIWNLYEKRYLHSLYYVRKVYPPTFGMRVPEKEIRDALKDVMGKIRILERDIYDNTWLK